MEKEVQHRVEEGRNAKSSVVWKLVSVTLVDASALIVSFLAHYWRYPLLESILFCISFTAFTHLWIWYAITRYSKNDAGTLLIDPVFLQLSVLYLYLGLASVPPLFDPSVLNRSGQTTHYFYIGMPIVVVGIVFLLVGCRVSGYRGFSPALLGGMREEIRRYSTENWRVLILVLALLSTMVWALRMYGMASGTYFMYSGEGRTEVSGFISIAIYLPMELDGFILPIAFFVLMGAPKKYMKALCITIIAGEFANNFAISTRTQMLTLLVQAIAIYCIFVKIKTKTLFYAFVGLVLAFFLVVQPLTYAYRYTTRQLSFQGISLYDAFWGQLWYETAENIQTGSAGQETEGWGERDLKYRLAAQGYISALAGAIIIERRPPPYGEFTIRNIGSVIPTIIWREKWRHAIMLMKAQMPIYYGIPRTDYMQTLTAHFLADAGVAGVCIGMFLFGIYMAMITRHFGIGILSKPIRGAMLFYLIPAIFFDGVGDFKDYFLMPWRTGLAAYLLIVIILSLGNGRKESVKRIRQK